MPPAAPQVSRVPPPGRWALLGQFALIPLVIVLVAVAVFVLFGMVAAERRGARDYLNEIRTGSANRRWQAAYELSRELRHGAGSADANLVSDIAATLDWAADEDPQVRRYLVTALGYLGDRRAVPSLIAALDDPDADTRLWAAQALGTLGDTTGLAALAGRLADPDPAVRKQAAWSLGEIGDRAAASALRTALVDAVDDVRWNAALALARLDDPAGEEVIGAMLDRAHLARVPGIRPDQIEAALLGALHAAGELRLRGERATIETLSRADDSLRVRDAARRSLERLDRP